MAFPNHFWKSTFKHQMPKWHQTKISMYFSTCLVTTITKLFAFHVGQDKLLLCLPFFRWCVPSEFAQWSCHQSWQVCCCSAAQWQLLSSEHANATASNHFFAGCYPETLFFCGSPSAGDPWRRLMTPLAVRCGIWRNLVRVPTVVWQGAAWATQRAVGCPSLGSKKRQQETNV